MRSLWWVGLFLLLLPFQRPSAAQPRSGYPYAEVPPHADTAWAYVGTQETGRNCGPEVRAFLAATGLGCGYPWCAAFVSYALTKAGADRPKTRSAATRHFIQRGSIQARRVLRGEHTPTAGTLIVWRKGNTPYGHIGIVMGWDGRCGSTVEGNTSAGRSGHQRDGDGVWFRWRCIHPGSYFRITHFTPVFYE